MWPENPAGIIDALRAQHYLADTGLAYALHFSHSLGRPLLLEGEPGVGKTEAALAVAQMSGAELIRLQCYEGIDRSQALYSWDFARQLLHLRAVEASGSSLDGDESSLYAERFLIERPLLRALRKGHEAVLLIDEIDRADDEFEAFQLELLSSNQVTIPELGTLSGASTPMVVLTSNRTRQLSDALRRRCLYHWIEHPDLARETEIVQLRVPEVSPSLAAWASRFVARLRELGLYKPPGVAETIDWVRVVADLTADGGFELDPENVRATIGVVLKDHDDVTRVQPALDDIVAEVNTQGSLADRPA